MAQSSSIKKAREYNPWICKCGKSKGQFEDECDKCFIKKINEKPKTNNHM